MLDFNNLPQPINVEVFNGGKVSSGTGSRSTVWTKPRNCQNVGIICVGGGGRGGTGGGGVAGTTRLGGGGGGCGGVVAIYLPSLIVPPRLHVQVGIGGGIISGQNNGTSSFVALHALYTGYQSGTTLCLAEGGNAGSGNAGGGAGGSYAKGAATDTLVTFAKGLVVTKGTGAGQSGQTSVTDTNQSTGQPTYQLTRAGAGGGVSATNVAYAGGEIQSQPPIFNSYLNTSEDGDTVWEENGYLFSSRGGAGGNGNSTGQGNRGGNGGLGCGGGGSGAGLTSGVPGNGGDGVVIIVTW